MPISSISVLHPDPFDARWLGDIKYHDEHLIDIVRGPKMWVIHSNSQGLTSVGLTQVNSI